jgi:hypothetical protein
MDQKNFYSHKPYSHNVPYRFLGRNSVHFGRPPCYTTWGINYAKNVL